MKISLIALAVAAAIPALAQAQTSNVIMYGRLDLGYNKSTGGKLNMAQQSGSRLGMRGSENLGGGLAATFQIEHRFNADNGSSSNNRFWHGRSIVGLKGGFGEINLGHNYTPNFWVALAADPWGWDTVSQISNTQPGGGQVRFSNSFEYVTPSMGGLAARVMFAPSEVAGVSSNAGFSLVYNAGKLYAGFGYEKHGYNAATCATASAVCVGQAAPTAADNKAMNLTVNYDFGAFRLLTNYSQVEVGAAAAVKGFNVSGAIPMGAGQARVTFGKVKSGVRDIGVGYHHNLSNRTKLYVDFNQSKPAVGGSITSYDFGLHHNF
jgi:predicted porin